MGKSITESNKIDESYLTRLFLYASSTIDYPKLRIIYHENVINFKSH